MKVDENNNCDRYGRYYIKFTGVRRFQEIVDWLHQHCYGYKFGITIDCTRDECQDVGNEYWVYFLDELTDEVMDYSDFQYDSEQKIYKRRGVT